MFPCLHTLASFAHGIARAAGPRSQSFLNLVVPQMCGQTVKSLDSYLNQGQPSADALHPLWRELRDAAGRAAYLNPFTGRLAPRRFAAPLPVRGGILADEMGLGKTVEVLACLLAHPFPGPHLPAGLVRPCPTLSHPVLLDKILV